MTDKKPTYKCRWTQEFNPGYVVYRHVFDDKCSYEDGIRAHKVALFVSEDEAVDYCKYRNKTR